MSDFDEQARRFLSCARAKIDIVFVGCSVPEWDTKPHNTYNITITSEKSSMCVTFYDSLANTTISKMSYDDYAKKRFKALYCHLLIGHQNLVRRELAELKKKAVPTAYDVLACLQKYETGSFDDFCLEFGYSNDSIRALKTFLACGEEYRDLQRCFTEQQIEQMREII